MAQRTYTGTTFHPTNLAEATVTLYIFDSCKYSDDFDSEKVIKTTYRGLTSWTIVEGGEEAEEIEALTDGSSIDEYHEYLILRFEDGSESTFRNSHVTMFII